MYEQDLHPELTPAVLGRLHDHAAGFRDAFGLDRPARWCPVYLAGLIQEGQRKSIEPLPRRVALPPELVVKDPEQALQQLVDQSPRDGRAVLKRYRAVMAKAFASPRAIFVIDDTSSPKQGQHSVGVQRRYCGALGKEADCQCATSVHSVSPKGHYPLSMRLDLPESWTGGAARLDKAGVPEDERRPLAEGQIALESLDRVRGEGLPGRLVVADAGYGVSGPSREGLEQRGLSYIVGVTEELVVFADEPRWAVPPWSGRGPRPARPRLTDDSPRPVSLRGLAARAPLREVTWREGTKGELSGRFAWLRVWPASGWETGQCSAVGPIWLLIEEQADGKLEYAFSNLPADTSRLRAVRLWKGRWPVEQGYQPMKEELGLDHFEGRSWRGFHHHISLVMLAYGSLALERSRAKRPAKGRGKRGVRSR